MTISRLDMKVSEVCIALGAGSNPIDLISDMQTEGFPPVIIDRIMHNARIMLANMDEEPQEIRIIRIQEMISDALDNRPD